jgi:hypothetical protein
MYIAMETVNFENATTHIRTIRQFIGIEVRMGDKLHNLFMDYVELSAYCTVDGHQELTQFLTKMREELELEGSQHNGLGFLRRGGYGYVQHPLRCSIFQQQDHITTKDLYITSYYESWCTDKPVLTIRLQPTVHAIEQAELCLLNLSPYWL